MSPSRTSDLKETRSRMHLRPRSVRKMPSTRLRATMALTRESGSKMVATWEYSGPELTTFPTSPRSDTAGTRPLVYAEIWNDPITTAGTNSFLSDLINLAGGRNLGDQAGNDYFTLDPEWILKQNPDIILCFYMSREGTVRETVLKRPGWAHVKAVTNGAVYDGFDNNIILRPGPRVIQGIEALHRSISQSVP